MLTLGILLHASVPLHTRLLFVVSAGLALLAAATLRYRIFSTILLALLILLLGVGLAQREHFAFAPNDIGQFADDEPRLTELKMRLVDDPQIVTGPVNQPRQLPPKQSVLADVVGIKTWTGWQTVSGRVPVQINEPHPALAIRQTIRALGMLQRPRPAMNPGEFDWAAYYREQRILSTFTIRRIGNIHILSDPGPSALDWLRSKTRHLLASGFESRLAVDHALLAAIVLGDHSEPLREARDDFQEIGVGYQLSVSGLHIAILAAVVFWLCRAVLFRPRVTLIITTGFVLLYTSVSMPSHSGTRAMILCLVVAAATLTGRSTDRAQLLSLAVIAMLLWHPMDLYTVGFHLSFAVVIVFLLLLPPLQQWWRSQQNADDAVLARTVVQTPSQKWRWWLYDWLARCAMYSLLAWLATLPLVVYHFGQVSTWSIATGLLLLPVVVIALFGGVLKILFTLLWPSASHLWATVAVWPPEGMLWAVHLLAKLPGSSMQLPTPPIWLIIAYYLLLLAPVWPAGLWLNRWQYQFLRLGPILAVATIFATPLLRHSPSPKHGDLTFTLLSIGAGQTAVLEPPNGHAIFFDAGSSTIEDVDRKVIEPFLRSEGENQVERIFLSHGDFDHISAAGEIATNYDLREVLTSYHFQKNSVDNLPDQLLLDELQNLDRTPREIALGDRIDLGHGVTVDVLWPPKIADLNSNNAGLVLRLTYAGRSILLPADIQDPAFIGVLKNAKALQSDILIAPHHGSAEDMTPAFLAAVHPKMILSSNASRLSSKQKRFETMVKSTPLYRTPECGAITVTIHADGTIAITTFAKGAKPKQ